MENALTKALNLGDIVSLAEFTRINEKILTDNWLFNEVVRWIIAERGPTIIQQAHPRVRKAFVERLEYMRTATQIRVTWEWIEAHATASARNPVLRANRFINANEAPEERIHFDPTKYETVEQFALIEDPWIHTRVSGAVVAHFQFWKSRPSLQRAADLREIAAQEAEKQQQKQAPTGILGEAINIQKAFGPDKHFIVDNSKEKQP